MTPVPHVLVCGAGLTGLTTAWHLRQEGVDVTVLEASDELGGVMRTTQHDGYLVEHGPNSCMLTAELADLVETLGLEPLLRPAAPAAQRRYIVRDGRALAVPMSPVAMLRSPLFSLAAKLRLLREPFVARRNADDDESVAGFIRRRLGSEPLTWAVDPFVSGVYAGDPEQLSVTHAFPRLAALEREHGSIARAAFAGAKRGHRERRTGESGAKRPTMVSFVDGMATLPHAIADDIGGANIIRRTRVTAIALTRGKCSVTVERDGATATLEADAVVSTLPMHTFQAIGLPEGTGQALAQLGSLPYPPVASLALGYRRADVAHPLDGFGCLIPSAERRSTLGVLFSSTLFSGRAPEDRVLLTCFLGGVRHPELGLATTASLLKVVTPELAEILGVSGAPTLVEHTSWPHAIPQYNLGHGAHARAADAIEAIVPGLIVDGQFRRGVSVGDCVAAGATIATRALAIAIARSGAAGAGRGETALGASPMLYSAPAAVA